ncbi:glycoside hydrolase family 2 protein [Vagococcus zengguangii]|uniref:Glycoside hydrolase family 2 n=1 Tax=Vagococcus zengguangii TaxID=2571750 RepID=A0A4D7CSM3_9ENTE|nr:sugar-binding domain-containing protein [Vagococcus zengguangii]QCI85692.1 glycoside hydrolase family 2 [Vagococcus zengguangii]TLG81633.1 glycoside hydrolase family 2 [Vagococcus zengguangii]
MVKTIDLYTKWGEYVVKTDELPLNDYPRPQLRRDNWQNLNGFWEYAISQSETVPDKFDGQIRVPFSPESLLSGVQRLVTPADTLWYRRKLTVEQQDDKRVLLHFGAVDQICQVWLNGRLVGEHVGGYWPFTFDITNYLQSENELLVKVKDASDNPIYAYGKQKLQHGQIWYTPQSGIWQTVWLEQVPSNYVENLTVTPNFDESSVTLSIETAHAFEQANIVISKDGREVVRATAAHSEITIELPEFDAWTPDTPHLYDVEVTLAEDRVQSYFGMRKFSIGKNAHGQTVPLLNNQPIFHNGLLDQGYWSDGLYTPPSDEAMIWDIEQVKALGFNMLRKHIKVEPLRWYYHCDRLGMLVWQDFVSGGAPEYSRWLIQILPFINIQLKDNKYKWFRRESLASRQQFETEMHQTVATLKNVTSLATWVPFNEGWGQFDSTRIGDMLRDLDPTRLIDYVSGYHDQGEGDFKSPHIYYKKYRLKPDKHERIQILSEFGGYSLPTEHHMGTDKLFGYKMYQTPAEFSAAYEKLFVEEIYPAIEQGLSGTVYTQVSDVEEEINGLFTYDRRVIKIDQALVRRVNQEIYRRFATQQSK